MDTTISRYHGHKKDHYLFNKLFTKSYDKRQEDIYNKIGIIKYPSSSSLLSKAVGYNIITTQCHRLAILNMCMEDFIDSAMKVYHELATKGYGEAAAIKV